MKEARVIWQEGGHRIVMVRSTAAIEELRRSTDALGKETLTWERMTSVENCYLNQALALLPEWTAPSPACDGTTAKDGS